MNADERGWTIRLASSRALTRSKGCPGSGGRFRLDLVGPVGAEGGAEALGEAIALSVSGKSELRVHCLYVWRVSSQNVNQGYLQTMPLFNPFTNVIPPCLAICDNGTSVMA